MEIPSHKIIHKKFDEAARWSNLRKLCNPSLVAMAPAAPLIGYLILFSEGFVNFTRISTDIISEENTLWLTHTDKLYFIYYGLIFVGIGAFVYYLCCPPILKKYGQMIDYIHYEMGLFTSGEQKRALLEKFKNERETEYNFPSVRESTENSFSYIKLLIEKFERDITHDEIWKLMEFRFSTLEHASPKTRYIVALFVILGLGLLAVPSALTFVEICKKIFF